MKKNLFIALVAMLLLASCTAGPNIGEDIANTKGVLAGFWLGLWHGLISPITFIISSRCWSCDQQPKPGRM